MSWRVVTWPTPVAYCSAKFRNPAKLIRRQSAERDLDTDHLNTGLPLAVNAILETEGPEQIGGDVAGNHATRLGFEGLDLLEQWQEEWALS